MEFRPHPFDVETVFATAKKKQARKPFGSNSPLYTSIWPMVYVMRIFGFAPYEFSENRLVPSNVYLIFSMIIATLYSYILYVIFQRFANIKRERAILNGTEYAKVIINYSVMMYELGLAIFTRRNFVRIWNALQNYDKRIRQLGHPRKEKLTAIAAWILTGVTTIVWIIVNRTGMYAFSETWILNMEYMLLYIGTSIAIYKFVAMAFFLSQRFHQLNTIATKNFPSMSETTNVNRKTIKNLHNDLMLIAENLESLYSWSLLFWLGNLSLHTISNAYFIIDSIFLPSSEIVNWPLICCLSAWLVAFLFQLLLLHIACHFVSSQANCIGPILIEWQMRLMRKNEECIESSLHYLNRKFNFSAGGCFYVNLSLLRSIATLLTTYLVILLQLPY